MPQLSVSGPPLLYVRGMVLTRAHISFRHRCCRQRSVTHNSHQLWLAHRTPIRVEFAVFTPDGFVPAATHSVTTHGFVVVPREAQELRIMCDKRDLKSALSAECERG